MPRKSTRIRKQPTRMSPNNFRKTTRSRQMKKVSRKVHFKKKSF